MTHRFALAALAAATLLAVAACASDRILGPTPTSYTRTASLRLLNPATHRLEPYTPPPREHAPGVSALISGTTTVEAVVWNRGDAGVAKSAMSTTTSGTTPDGHAVREVTYYRAGMPPSANYVFVDGKLAGTNVFTWSTTSTGWYLSKSVLTGYTKTGASAGAYTTLGEYTQVTAPCNPKVTACPPAKMAMSEALVRVLASVATATSCEARAQGSCLREGALVFVAWAAFIVGIATAETGVGAIGAAGAYVGTGVAEYDYLKCRRGNGAYGVPQGGGGGAGSGGSSSDDCNTGGLSCPVLWTQ